MFWIDLLLVLFLAMVISSLMTWGLGWRHPSQENAVGASLLFLFIVLLVAMWAGAAWFPRWGPVWYGTTWLTPVLIGLFVALLILAVSAPPRRPRSAREARAQAEQATAIGTAFGLFFWILLAGLLMAALIRYFL